jgi:serine/threonine-protein kinase
VPDSGAPDALAELPDTGDLIDGRYRVGRMIGIGGMGIVRAATHETLGHELALKFMLPAAAKSKDAAERFVREARASARLTSEHVARVLDVGRLPSGLPYIVMERLRGEDLATLLDSRGRLEPGEAVGYVLEAIHAIAEAHLVGIVHRDIKPRNLFLTRRSDGRTLLKVLDFGIAKAGAALGEGTLTQSRHTLGSPQYMSPEQLEDSAGVDARTDIWSLGVVLYQLTSGALPFEGETLAELSSAIRDGSPRPLSERVQDLPRELAVSIERCLAKDPSKRPASVLDLARSLEPFAARDARSVVAATEQLLSTRGRELEQTLELASDPSTASYGERGRETDDTHAAVESRAATSREPPRRPKRVALVVAGLVALGAAGVWIARESSDEPAAAERTHPPSAAFGTASGAIAEPVPFRGAVGEGSARAGSPLAVSAAPPPSASGARPSVKLPRRPFPPAAATATERPAPGPDPYLDRK